MFPSPQELLALWLDMLEFCANAADPNDPAHRKAFASKMAHWDRTYKFAGKDRGIDRQGEFHRLLAEDNLRWAASQS